MLLLQLLQLLSSYKVHVRNFVLWIMNFLEKFISNFFFFSLPTDITIHDFFYVAENFFFYFLQKFSTEIFDMEWTLCSIFRVISWPQFWPFSGRFCKHFWEFFRLIHYLWPLRMQLFYHEYPTKQEWNWVRSSGWNSRLKLQECCWLGTVGWLWSSPLIFFFL